MARNLAATTLAQVVSFEHRRTGHGIPGAPAEPRSTIGAPHFSQMMINTTYTQPRFAETCHHETKKPSAEIG